MLQKFTTYQLTDAESAQTNGGAAAAGVLQINKQTTIEYYFYTPSIGYIEGVGDASLGDYGVAMWITRNGVRHEVQSRRRISRLNERFNLGIPAQSLV
ncbi:MAG: hypothetical protein J0L94_04825 [Rhodothermia bacterium]|nr:hypothetical protein [Rhodothermia bacterium]